MSDLILRCGAKVNGHQTIEALFGERVVARDLVDLDSTDSRRRFGAIICNDLPAAELDSIDRELLKIKSGKYENWEDPLPVDRPVLPKIPIDGLPDRLRLWIEATAEATQTPVELPALLALAACSGMVARRIVIEPRAGWIEPINLYTTTVLDPGNRKSTVVKKAFEPISKIEIELRDAARPVVARAETTLDILRNRLEQAKKKAQTGDSAAGEEAFGLAAEYAKAKKPVLPRLLADDGTPEAIEQMLAAQNGQLILAGAEGGVFDVMGGRYSKGIPNFDVFLKGHSGDDLRIDRVTRDSVYIENPCLTLAYAIQPAVIQGFAAKPTFRGKGLLGRFLYALPKSTLGSRKIAPDPVPKSIAANYEQLIRELHGLARLETTQVHLQLSSHASLMFDAFEGEVEGWLGEDGLLTVLSDWASKLAGLTARLAAIIHLANLVGEKPTVDLRLLPVGDDSVAAAIEIARWAVPHARASIGLMAGDDGSVVDADAVLRWLQKREKAQVSRRDIGQQFRSRFDHDQKRLDRALEVLMDRGWLRPVDDHGGRAGRPSLRFDCHPWIAKPPRVSGVL